MRSLNEFKAHIDNLGTVKSNRFEVFFHKNSESWPTAPRDLTFRCESLNIPGSQILTTDYKLYGGEPITKIPNGKSFDEVQMTFLTTGDMRDKYFFDEWIDEISDLRNNTIAYYYDICCDINIDIFNEVGPVVKPIYSIKMVNTIPTRVEAVQVSWADVDQLLKYTVNFSCESLQYIRSSNNTQFNFAHLDKTQG